MASAFRLRQEERRLEFLETFCKSMRECESEILGFPPLEWQLGTVRKGLGGGVCCRAAAVLPGVFPPPLMRIPGFKRPSSRPAPRVVSPTSSPTEHVFSVLGAVSRILGVCGRDTKSSASEVRDEVSSNTNMAGLFGTRRNTLGD